MNASTAINVFARAVVRQRRIPFEISSPESDITREDAMHAFTALRAQAKNNGIADMSLDNIKGIHLLAFVFMKPFNLDVKNGIRV